MVAKGLAPGHMGRYREIARVLAEEGLGAIALRLGLPEALHSRPEHLRDATTPERVRRSLERLGPAAVKLGQMLSTRSDLIPEEYRTELKRLQDKVSPISYDEVCRVIEEQLGKTPDEMFEQFDHTPMAAASIGQVHAARLRGGERVAVKVQRPDILAKVEQDLDIVRTQARRVTESKAVKASVDIAEIAEEFSRAVMEELDYLNEARNVERFRAAFADREGVVIPRVFGEYSSRRVLTLERLEGIPFNRLDLIDEARLDRHDLAVRGVRAYLVQIYEMGIYHADPHPGNLFALPDDRIGFTDFGRTGTVPAGIGDAASDLLLAMVDRDADLATDALLDVSRDPGLVNAEQLHRELSVLIGKYHGVELGDFRMGEVLDDILDVVREQQLGLPSELVMMLGTMAVLEGVGRDLDPGFDFIEVARPFADEIIKRQFEPSQVRGRVTKTARRWLRTVTELPSSVDRVLRRVAEGELRIAVRPEGVDRLLDRAEELVDRLAFSVLIAAFVLAFSRLLTVDLLPAWVKILLLIGMIGALGVSGWMFTSILLARWRGRS